MENILGDRVKFLLHGKPVTKAAEEIGITQSVLSDIIRGKKKAGISSSTLVQLCSYFHVSADYLLGLSDNAAVDPEIQAVCKYTGLRDKAVEVLHSLANDNFGKLKLFWLNLLMLDDDFLDFLDDVSSASYFSGMTQMDIAINMLRSEHISNCDSIEEFFKKVADSHSIVLDSGSVPFSTEESAEYYRYKATIKLNKMLERLGGVMKED